MSDTASLIVWLVGALVLIAVETTTLAFVAVYVALGALCAAIATGAGAGFGGQVIVFVLVSVSSLVLTRKPLRNALGKTPLVRSNVQTIMGRHAVVTVAVPAGPGSRGQIKVGTEYWSAKREQDIGDAIPEGTTVEVLGVEGVTAVVRPLEPEVAA
ncbi:MAG: NfeD family protein [Actinobacteria bacterium]|nr:MAG: NfeD family protein [Actinomycetota bacterium]